MKNIAARNPLPAPASRITNFHNIAAQIFYYPIFY